MDVTGKLDPEGARRLADKIGTSYIIAACAAAVGALAALIHAARWW